MATFSSLLVPLALGAVVVVLALGLANMLRGDNPTRSQSLMRWRVILQGLAVLIMLVLVFFKAR